MHPSRHPSPLPPMLHVSTAGSPLPPIAVKAGEGSPLPPDPDVIATNGPRLASGTSPR
jgi:hypothetical protein